jgi:hypothetical protein
LNRLKETTMKVAPCVLVAVLAATAGTVAGCTDPYYTGTRYGYSPQYAYSYPSDRYYGDSSGYSSKWDYYRNYQGAVKPGPERYP